MTWTMFCHCCRGVFAGLLFFCIPAPIHAGETHQRVALLMPDARAPDNTCHLKTIAKALEALRFKVRITSVTTGQTEEQSFAASTTNAEAAIIYACNAPRKIHLPDMLKASKLNILFLLETTPADPGSPIVNPLKTSRNDLVILHVRVASPENDEIFTRTLARKIKRPYSLAHDIISRTITSSYYESRGTILIEKKGEISSDYILARPPTDKILDAWSRVQSSNNRKNLEAFIARFPDTLFADLARSRLEKLP